MQTTSESDVYWSVPYISLYLNALLVLVTKHLWTRTSMNLFTKGYRSGKGIIGLYKNFGSTSA